MAANYSLTNNIQLQSICTIYCNLVKYPLSRSVEFRPPDLVTKLITAVIIDFYTKPGNRDVDNVLHSVYLVTEVAGFKKTRQNIIYISAYNINNTNLNF